MPVGTGEADPPEPTASERERLRRTRERLLAAAAGSGTLRFDHFMEIALYEPGLGFYASPEVAIGRRGSFYTAPQVSPLFGAALAERIVAEHERLGRPAGFSVVEIGPGDGTLAADVLRALGDRPTPVAIADYRLVERSDPLRDRALERARAAAPGGGIEVRASRSIGEEGPFEGIVVANEFLDALPVRRLLRRDDGWRELEVRFEGGHAAWTERPLDGAVGPPPIGSAEDGTIVERSPLVAPALREIADHLVRGAALLVDFGEEAAALRRAHPRGTLAALWRHQALDDPLALPGLADLSAFVDFTLVRAAARSAGLEETANRTQAEALAAWGLPGLLEAAVARAPNAEAGVRVRLAAKNLLFGFPTFRCLELAARSGGG
jgi:SAM-dependent MidA family methyltransferase